MQQIIVGEIEGDRARLALARKDSAVAPIEIDHEVRFERSDLHAFEERFQAFKRDTCPDAQAAALSIGGPIEEGSARLTKESFIISARRMMRIFDLSRVVLMNDCAALARGAVEAPPEAFVTLVQGEGDAERPVVVVRPGVGLGMASIRKRDGAWLAEDSEGGHQAYAPGDLDEMEVWRALLPNRHYVTFEDIVCEGGVVESYRHLARLSGAAQTLRTFTEVADAARTGASEPAVRACKLAARSLATFAGNGCLAFGGRAGAIISGSVATKLEPFLVDPAFAQRFQRRGPMTLYLADVPVRLMKDEAASLRGVAAHCFALSD